MAEPLVTVVVLNWNGAHLLGDCLAALAAQDVPKGRMQTWVVDNASSDGSLRLLADKFHWVRVIANERNDGFAGGNNLALREVATPFVSWIGRQRPSGDDDGERTRRDVGSWRTGRTMTPSSLIAEVPP